jgi:uncharacterized NAD-dependent epimerase/dehydratase family protein
MTASSALNRPVATALPSPYLLFLGDATEPGYAKTAFGLRDWAPERCVGEWSCAGATVTTGLSRLTPKEARARGARALVIGVANIGGIISEQWIPSLLEALESGLDIVSGMHTKLNATPALRIAAERRGRMLIDVRTPPENIAVASGRRRSGKRLLTVGTDCALGKKYCALALTRAFGARGLEVDFRATGQTGIMISGRGIPTDAPALHWDIIEGQGSLAHPAYAGVSLGLLHGSQPDVIVVCHEPGREHILGLPGYAMPSIEETIELNLTLGRRTNPNIRCAGVSLNTARFDAKAAATLIAAESARLALPVADPMRGGADFERLVDACLG